MDLEGVFDTVFLPQYIRHTKSATQKNLRCFPHCGASKHITYSFCGAPVVLKVSFRSAPTSRNILAFGDIVPHGSEPSQLAIFLTEMQNQATVGNGLRLGVETTKVVKDESYESITFSFNNTRQPWHYGWCRYGITEHSQLFLKALCAFHGLFLLQ
jgi:hypothetical protein